MLQSFILISSVCFSLAFGALARTFAYRAFRNDPALTRPCDELLFGKAYLTLVFAADDTLTGTVGDVDWQLNVTGVFTNSSLSFVGRGEVGGAPWVYNYSGILFNTLPAATMVGTVQRLLAHGPASPANESASFYAVETEPHRAITTVVGSSLVLTVIFSVAACLNAVLVTITVVWRRRTQRNLPETQALTADQRIRLCQI